MKYAERRDKERWNWFRCKMKKQKAMKMDLEILGAAFSFLERFLLLLILDVLSIVLDPLFE